MYERVDEYWRVANYLSLAHMYLKDNVLLKRELTVDDVKLYSSGHWGTCPCVNFIIAHLNNYICKYVRNIQLIIGTGHSGIALSANLFLEETLQETYNLGDDAISALTSFVNIEKRVEGMRSEISPFYPGTIYDGGELGYSLATAMGAVLNNEDLLAVTIIGDGECETGCLSATWNTIKCLGTHRGHVLPIINLNGFRMGAKSMLSSKTDVELTNMFCGMGYSVKIVNGDHNEMAKTLDWAERIFSAKRDILEDINPLIIVRTPKGWTAPEDMMIHIEGNIRAHKNPLKDLSENSRTFDYLKRWLKSYKPEELFNENGTIKQSIRKMIPPNGKRLGDRTYKKREIIFPELENFECCLEDEPISGMANLERYLGKIIRANGNGFKIMSPDELSSNLLGRLLKYKENIIEILNENICQAWMQGYCLAGGCSLMISYEAFMPIITSMVSQYSKYLYQSERCGWRSWMPSMNYILTSTCWENTYSHQNPDFVNSLIIQQDKYARIYYPVDANTLIVAVDQSLKSEGKINVITTAKKAILPLMTMGEAKKAIEEGYYIWNEEVDEPDLVLIAIGDYSLREMKSATTEMKKRYPSVSYRLVSILELSKFTASAMLTFNELLNDIFKNGKAAIFLYHGYSLAINAIFGQQLKAVDYVVLGYRNKSISSVDLSKKMEMNECSAQDILLHANELLFQNGIIGGEK